MTAFFFFCIVAAAAVEFLWLCYLLALAVASLRPGLQQAPDARARVRLAVIMPAHNEEATVAAAVASVAASDYAPERYDIVVVADNCTDATAREARCAGARVLDRSDPHRRGKGHALAFALEHLREAGQGYDAYVFLDADTAVAPDFLARMAGWVAAGRGIIQGCYTVADPDRTWFTRLTALGFILKNRFQYPGLEALGLSVPLRGSGMCFASSVIRQYGWASTSLTEDWDYSVLLIEAGERIRFDPLAENQQYMPPTPAAAVDQRMRWSAGEVDTVRRRVRRLLLRALLRRDVRSAAQWAYFSMPPLSAHLVASASLAAAAAALAWSSPGTGLLPLWGCLLVTALFSGYFVLALTGTGLHLRYAAALGMIPVYALWRVVVHAWAAAQVAAGKTLAWKATRRT